MKFFITSLLVLVSSQSFAKEKEPKLLKGWEVIQIGSYSGKPGYFAKVGNDFQMQVDAVVMNDSVLEELNKAFSKAAVGGVKTCHALGIHQVIGYSLFKVKNCQ